MGRNLTDYRKTQTLRTQKRRAAVAVRFAQLMTPDSHGRFCPNPGETMAREFGVCSAVISRDLKALKLEWREQRLTAVDQIVDAVLAECDWVKQQARVEWERSKLNAETTVTEASNDSGSERRKVQKTSKGQTGDPRYLAAILEAEDKRIRLTVGYKPTKSESVNVDPSTWTDAQLEAYRAGIPLVDVLTMGRADAVR